jgi:spore maturation protein CgeB
VKALLVHPGAEWSIADVHDGMHRALVRAGHEVVSYNLSGRIQSAGGWLKYCWKRAGSPKDNKPGVSDTLYLAGQGVLERALRHDVDWTIIISAMYLHPESVHLLRKAGRKVAVYLTESPYDAKGEDLIASAVDVVFTNERSAVDHFRAICPRSYYLAHSFDPERHNPETPDFETAAHDVVFVGTGFEERVAMLSAVDWTGIDLGLYGSWSLLGSRHPLRRYLRGHILPNTLTAALYHNAKIGLNIHRTSIGWGRTVGHIEGAESVNPRVVELAACGRFFLSDSRPELHEWFNGTVPTFATASELEAQIRRWLQDDAGRAEIAAKLPAAIAPQTFDNRAQQMVEYLEAV